MHKGVENEHFILFAFYLNFKENKSSFAQWATWTLGKKMKMKFVEI